MPDVGPKMPDGGQTAWWRASLQACGANTALDAKLILRAGSGKARFGFRSDQALFQALQEDFAGKFDANEHHLAYPLLVLAPGGSQITAH